MKNSGIKAHMEKLRHPMKNHVNCWGGQNDEQRSVVLLIWQDQFLTVDGKRYVEIQRSPEKQIEADDRVGRSDRERHIRLVKDEGYDCFLINQIAVDPKASPRSRHGFQDRSLFKAGQIIEIENGRRVIEVVGRLDVHEFLRDSNQVGS